jgi:hypothetical protein
VGSSCRSSAICEKNVELSTCELLTQGLFKKNTPYDGNI